MRLEKDLLEVYGHSMLAASNRGFPVERRVERQEMEPWTSPSEEELELWREEIGLKLGPLVPTEHQYKVLKLVWTYHDLGAKDLKDIPPTDLILHCVRLRTGTTPYSHKQRKYARNKEWWLRKIVQEGVDAGMYERTSSGGKPLS